MPIEPENGRNLDASLYPRAEEEIIHVEYAHPELEDVIKLIQNPDGDYMIGIIREKYDDFVSQQILKHERVLPAVTPERSLVAELSEIILRLLLSIGCLMGLVYMSEHEATLAQASGRANEFFWTHGISWGCVAGFSIPFILEWARSGHFI